MKEQQEINFNRIAEAIDYIKNNIESQPSLEDIAAHVNMSSFHFQKMFIDWAGVSPKKFLQFITLSYAKNLLREKKATLFDTTIETGLSSTSRLHDLFINIEGMTPLEFKNEGENLTINYSFYATLFGNIIVAATAKGVCYVAFFETKQDALTYLKSRFKKAQYFQKETSFHLQVKNFFANNFSSEQKIKLHIKGTSFQLKVWETLLTIPLGNLRSYGDIAKRIESPKASRAVGSAIGDNPIAFLIPCHRVIQSTGIFGGYMWGPKRKTAIIGWEAAKVEMI